MSKLDLQVQPRSDKIYFLRKLTEADYGAHPPTYLKNDYEICSTSSKKTRKFSDLGQPKYTVHIHNPTQKKGGFQ